MTEKEKHLELRKKTFVVPDVVKPLFNDKELGLLQEYGTWLEGLFCEEIKPLNDKHREFVSSVRLDIPPRDKLFELYWRYVKGKELLEPVSFEYNEIKIKDEREEKKKVQRERWYRIKEQFQYILYKVILYIVWIIIFFVIIFS